MFWTFPLKVQSYDSRTVAWYSKTFETHDDFLAFNKEQFKIPGEYNLRDTHNWQIEGLKYSQRAEASGKANFEGGVYTDLPEGSPKFKAYWANEKDKVLKGVIIDGIYIPPFYYWYLNYCPIYDDIQKRRRLGDPWDGDLWYFHYCMLCILQGKFIGGVKGRQKGYSYKHMAILYWCYSWFESSVSTLGAFEETLVKKSWRFLEGYRNHINKNTVWKRGPKQAKSLEWNEITFDIDEVPLGLQSILKGVTFRQSPEKDVGGTQTVFNYEEPGVSPTLLGTLEYIKPALIKGADTVGIFIATGSVGNLEDADGLKKIFYNPDDYNFLGLDNIWDNDPNYPTCCIFISEAYNMIGKDQETGKPFMDKDGNSDVPFAMEWIAREQEKVKNSNKSTELKQIALSQKCTSPKQAFDARTDNFFPAQMIQRQQERIDIKNKQKTWDYQPRKGLLYIEDNGEIKLNSSNCPIENVWPVDAKLLDKRGVVTIYKPPIKNRQGQVEWLTYFAGVDPIEAESTTTSDSLFSMHIFETVIEVEYEEGGKIKTRIEGDRVVATYVGRFDDSNGGTTATNEQGELLIRLYNAFAFVERNKPSFVNHMTRRGLGRYIAKESDVPLFKDMNGTGTSNSKYGFYMDSTGKMNSLLNSTIKEYLLTEYDAAYMMNKDGTQSEQVVKIYRGLDRLDDYWALQELKLYSPNGNTDRRVSLGAAILIAKTFQNNRYKKKVSEVKRKEEPKNNYNGFSLLGKTRKSRSLLK